MPYVAGNEIDAHCPMCKADLGHTVLEVNEGLVRSVRCEKCAHEHQYQRPQTPSKKKAPKKAVKPKAKRTTKPASSRRKNDSPPQEWQERALLSDLEEPRPYALKETFAQNDLIAHKKFGEGLVTAVQPDGKITVAFKDGYKTLVHGR